MSFQRWHELKELFTEARESSSEQRDLLLHRLKQQDAELWTQLTEMLRADESAGMLDTIINGAAGNLPGSLRIGPWQILQEIGRGATSIVYLAEHVEGRRVALKVIPRAMLSRDASNRLRRERRFLADLPHPYIARVEESGETEGSDAYLAMEYVDGLHLDSWCDQPGRSVDERLRVFVKICEAVSFSHQKLVVHRDLKPSNILVTRDGTPKLLDFGIAALLEPHSTLTLTGLHRFTLEYASPEQVRQDGAPSTSTDIYSLGVLLYRMLSGALPYRTSTRTPHEFLRAIFEEDPVPIREHSRMIPEDLESIVLKALEKDPRHRFLSVEQFAGSVQRYLDGFPVTIRGMGGLYRVRKLLRRQRISLTAAAVVLVSVTVAVYALWQQNQVRSRLLREALGLSAELFTDAGIFSPNGPRKLESVLASTLKAQEVLTRLAIESGDEAAQLRSIDLMHKASVLLGGPSPGGQLGRTGEAFRLSTQAAALADSLFQRSPERYPHSICVSVTHLALAGLLVEMGRLPEARQECLRAAAVHSTVAADDPHYMEKRQSYANALSWLSEVAFQKGDYDEAIRVRRQVVEIRRQGLAADSQEQSARQDLAGGLSLYGTALAEGRRTQEAIRVFEEALSLLAGLLKEVEFGDWRASHSQVLLQLGKAYLADDREREAETAIAQAVAAFRAAENLTPNAGNRRLLAQALSWLAVAQRDHAGGAARAAAREAIDIIAREVTTDRASKVVQRQAEEIQRRAGALAKPMGYRSRPPARSFRHSREKTSRPG